MAYVRTRTTSSGAISTALVESHRDEQGRPRQRILANLYGMPDVLSALAKLASERARLRDERDRLVAEIPPAQKFYEMFTTSVLAGRRYSPDERKEIDSLLKARERLLSRFAVIEAALTKIQKDGGVLKKHCDASEAEIQAAIKRHQEKVKEAESMVLGEEFMLRDRSRHKAQWRRLTIAPDPDLFRNLARLGDRRSEGP